MSDLATRAEPGQMATESAIERFTVLDHYAGAT